MDILLHPNSNLLEVCTEIEIPLNYKYWWGVSAEMKKLLIKNKGFGLAANQVGILKRMFIMETSPKVYHTFINPVITHQWGYNGPVDEYCLSHPGIKQNKFRWSNIHIQYIDLLGKERSEEYDGLLAQCIQHEIDHLNGIDFLSNRK